MSNTSGDLQDKEGKRVALNWSMLQATPGLATYFKREETLFARDMKLQAAGAIIEGIMTSRTAK